MTTSQGLWYACLMIEIRRGDLFGTITTDGTHAIVNAVNCQGVMGAGLAKVFAQRYPEMEQAYIEACKDGRCARGRCHLWPERGFYIVNFPSKPDVRVATKVNDITTGMYDLCGIVSGLGLRSVALPALGAGLGGCPWPDVETTIREVVRANEFSSAVRDCHWMLFEPHEISR